MDADAAIVTTSAPGKDIVNTTARLVDGLALVTVPTPEVTRVRLTRGAATIVDTIPGGSEAGPTVPSPLGRVIVSSDNEAQPVQVRTDGRTACRVTATRLSAPEVFAMEWNPFDEACAPIDGEPAACSSREDRGTAASRGSHRREPASCGCTGSDGESPTYPVADDEVPAFVDTSGHRPDRLTLAQAINTEGDEIARVVP